MKRNIEALNKNSFMNLSLVKRHQRVTQELQDPNFREVLSSGNYMIWIGRTERTGSNSLNFYHYKSRNFSDINVELNRIAIVEDNLIQRGFDVGGVKSFNRNTWFDLSKESNAMEGIFEDFDYDLREFRIELKGKFSISDGDDENFDYNDYFNTLLQREKDIQKKNDSVVTVINGKSKKHKLTFETVCHYIAFKYAYKCAKYYRNQDLTAHDYSRILQNIINLLACNVSVPFRKIQVYVNKNGYVDLAKWMPVKPTVISDKINALCNWLEKTNNINPIEKAAIAHAEYVRIHPFSDGNGRSGRILANFILMLNGFPTIKLRHKNTEEYFKAINKAIETHNCTDLIDMFAKEVKNSINDISECFENIEKGRYRKGTPVNKKENISKITEKTLK